MNWFASELLPVLLAILLAPANTSKAHSSLDYWSHSRKKNEEEDEGKRGKDVSVCECACSSQKAQRQLNFPIPGVARTRNSLCVSVSLFIN